ncbi:nuclear transport factor 2 family protein [Streptomyces sp. NBC_01485]|uniref:YybH family protein n=1 Tax=Streptomyces sp. NBC_01485 TaxID=2903884 RepID=UPI002E2ECB06|nr:nuclear transport factor 2 family protein [Streptomyces sp. NBC_01485]
MSKVRHTLPIVAAAIALTAGSIAVPAIFQAETANASPVSANSAAVTDPAEGMGERNTARTPAALLQLLGERIQAKDIDGIIALHEKDAALVNYDGSLVRGHTAIRAFYVDWFKLDPVLKVSPRQTVEAGGAAGSGNRMAAIMGVYTLEQNKPDGTRESFTGNFCDTVRQHANGKWMYVQDNPYPPHGGGTPVRRGTSSHH